MPELQRADIEIGHARADEVSSLPAIERAAARILDAHAPAELLGESRSVEELAEAQDKGRLYVARVDGKAVGFALLRQVEAGSLHLEEMDVAPEHAQRGLGRRLLQAVCEQAQRGGYRDVTLTTFREPAWNMPFYASAGFEELPRERWTPALVRLVDEETARGLEGSRRVLMRWPCEAEGR